MFEMAKCISRRPEWAESLSRLNRTQFLMFIDSASRAASHCPGKLNLSASSKPHQAESITYQANLKPVLDANCVSCHAPGTAGYEKSGLRLDSYDAMMKSSRIGPVVHPGSSVSSTLHRLMSGRTDPSIRMPHGHSVLPEETVAMIGAWIDQGAKYWFLPLYEFG